MSQPPFTGSGNVLQPQTSQETGIECGVCNENYTTEGRYVPKVLTCGHTVCKTCCWQLREHGHGYLKCPFDRIESRVYGEYFFNNSLCKWVKFEH